MRKFALILPALLVIGACSQQADAPSERQGADADQATTEAGNGASVVDATEEPVTTAGEAAPANTIPANFHGVWDYVEGTCALESDLRMEVSGREVLFYESVGIVSASVPDGDDVIVTLEMEGEGETWVQAYRLTLSDDGQTLNSEAIGEDFVGGPLPRKRCEG